MVNTASRNMRGVVIPWFSLEPASDFDVRANATAEKYSLTQHRIPPRVPWE